MLIDEHSLDDFRRQRLHPRALFDLIIEHVWVLLHLGVGVGKSAAIDAFLGSAALFDRFDLVIYAAPTWNIINERRIVSGADMALVSWMTIEPRPVEQCGPYADRWSELEAQSCTALAKATLCKECQANPNQPRCAWPRQLKRAASVSLVFMTEQQLRMNRSLVWLLRDITGARRVLVILDEAKLLDASFLVEIRRPDLETFRTVLAEIASEEKTAHGHARRWLRSVEELLVCPAAGISKFAFDVPPGFLRAAYRIQRRGVELHGRRFRFLAYDLYQLAMSRGEERSILDDGVVRFTARPYLGVHALIASAHLESVYAGHRLGTGRLASPFEHVVVRHSGTRIFNLRARLGANQYFRGNQKQILDTFAVAILRNVHNGRSTLLVSRLKSREQCAQYLRSRLAGWGIAVQFVFPGEALPAHPDPRTIPIIHYGVLGTNDYSEYETAYCVNSYYISSNVLNNAVQEFEPEQFHAELRIVSGPQMLRSVELVEKIEPDIDRTYLGGLYLRRLEIDPVVQAVGRVRFLTRPREVVFFQMADITPQVGAHTVVGSLVALRHALGLPAASEIDKALELAQIKARLGAGMTATAAARSLEISRATLYRRLDDADCLRTPNSIFSRGSETLGLGEA